jgi:hypothetical protein
VLVKISTNRTRAANALTLIFFIAILIGALASEFFQAPEIKNTELSRYQLLIQPEQLGQIKSIELKNRLGDFTISKSSLGVWDLSSPRNLPGSQATVANILKNLGEIKIRKILPKDPINISNYSLDTPLIKINLKYVTGKESTLNIGLVNPIDRSAYVSFTNQEAIYHVDYFTRGIESLNLANFIDSKVFTQNYNEISSVKIYKGKLPSTKTRLTIANDKGIWQTGSKQNYDQAQIKDYIEKLLSLKSSLILDKRTEKLEKSLERYFKSPSYTVEVSSGEDKVFYEISYLINSIPDIKMEKRQTFIIKATNRPHPYVIEKDKLSIFHKKDSSFKKTSIKSIKKLFY